MNDKNIKRIVVFRALHLGDMLCAVPAFRALRKRFANASITLVGLPWAQFMADRYPEYINEFIPFPGMKGLPEQIPNQSEWSLFTEKIKKRSFDLAIQLHGSGKISNELIRIFNTPFIAGSYVHEKPNNQFVRYREDIHEIHRLLSVINHLGADERNDDLFFPISNADHEEIHFLRLNLIKNSYVCIHPGARDPKRRWNAEYFALTADMLSHLGYQIVLTGTDSELPLVKQVQSLMKNNAITAAGKTSLGGLAALVKDAAFLISNCTGIAHLAAALKTRTVVAGLENEPRRWVLLNTDLHLSLIVTEDSPVHELIGKIKSFVEFSRCHLKVT